MLSRLPWHPGCWHLQRKQCQGLEVCSGRNGGDGKSLSCAWHGHLRTSRGPQNSKFFVPRLWFSEKFQAILSMVKPPSLADLMIESCQFDPGFFFSIFGSRKFSPCFQFFKMQFLAMEKKPLWFSFNQKTIQKHWILKATHCCYSETWCRRGDHRELVDVAGASGKLSSSSVLRVEGSPRGEFQQRKAGTTYKVVPHS
jgi:hypothetical protein